MPMNHDQIRLGVDPVLTNVSQKRRDNVYEVGEALFPDVPVMSRSGRIKMWGDEAFMIVPTERAPGAVFKAVDIAYSATNFNLVDHGLSCELAVEDGEEAKAVSVDLVIPKVHNVMAKMDLNREKMKQDLATNPANYGASNKVTLSGTSQWSDYVNSDPLADVNTAKYRIADTTGEVVNVIGVSDLTERVLLHHPTIIAWAKGLGISEVTLNRSMLERYFDVDRIAVSKATWKDSTGTFQKFWGRDVVLASVVSKGESKEYKSFGYNYQLKGYPKTYKKQWDGRKHTWYWNVSDSRVPVMTAPDTGYLITDAVAAV